jgi:hypothetical protein
MQPDEKLFLERAALYLERRTFVVRLANLLGTPVEKLVSALPEKQEEAVQRVVRGSLEKALGAAVLTLPASRAPEGSVAEIDTAGFWNRLRHQIATGATGAAGGFFGLGGVAVELPVTTTLMLRSIASIAQDFGEDLDAIASRMECIGVFSYGGPSKEDDALDSAYYGVRSSLAILLRQAAEFAAGKTAAEIAEALARGTAPAMARFVAAVASRFNVVVSEKVVAQAVPALGAISGATINFAFTDHFNNVARYHFGIRRLERVYGEDVVRDTYDRVRSTG